MDDYTLIVTITLLISMEMITQQLLGHWNSAKTKDGVFGLVVKPKRISKLSTPASEFIAHRAKMPKSPPAREFNKILEW